MLTVPGLNQRQQGSLAAGLMALGTGLLSRRRGENWGVALGRGFAGMQPAISAQRERADQEDVQKYWSERADAETSPELKERYIILSKAGPGQAQALAVEFAKMDAAGGRQEAGFSENRARDTRGDVRRIEAENRKGVRDVAAEGRAATTYTQRLEESTAANLGTQLNIQEVMAQYRTEAATAQNQAITARGVAAATAGSAEYDRRAGVREDIRSGRSEAQLDEMAANIMIAQNDPNPANRQAALGRLQTPGVTQEMVAFADEYMLRKDRLYRIQQNAFGAQPGGGSGDPAALVQ